MSRSQSNRTSSRSPSGVTQHPQRTAHPRRHHPRQPPVGALAVDPLDGRANLHVTPQAIPQGGRLSRSGQDADEGARESVELSQVTATQRHDRRPRDDRTVTSQRRVGLVWFDAPGDFNNPDTRPVWGSSTARDGDGVVGRCGQTLTPTAPGFASLLEARALLVGARTLDHARSPCYGPPA